MGTWTAETQTKMERWAIENVRMAVEAKELKSVVPEQRDIYEEMRHKSRE
jgi:hypothetical protein